MSIRYRRVELCVPAAPFRRANFPLAVAVHVEMLRHNDRVLCHIQYYEYIYVFYECDACNGLANDSSAVLNWGYI